MVQADSSVVGTATVQVLDGLIIFKVTSEETNGNYTLVESITPPGGGTPPHIQHKDTEAFYVLEGTYSFVLRDEVVEVGPGGHIFVPTETVHAFQNTGSEPARMLIMNAPGGIHEGFFKELGIPVEDPANPPEVDMQAQIATLMEIAPKYGIEILPPEVEE